MAATREWPEEVRQWVAAEGLDPADVSYIDVIVRLLRVVRNLRQRVAVLEGR